jgi:hypothetical protein
LPPLQQKRMGSGEVKKCSTSIRLAKMGRSMLRPYKRD